MAAQLGHLLEVSTAPNVKLQVLPFAAGQNGAMSGPVTILSFPDPDAPDIGYVEHSLGGGVIGDPDAVAALTTLFDDLRDHALSSRDSTRMIEQVIPEGRSTMQLSNWQKTSYSNAGGNCVEVTELADGARAVRDSKDRTGPMLRFTPTEWTAFTAGVRGGEFD